MSVIDCNASASSLYKEVITVEDKEAPVIAFSFATYNSDSPSYPGWDAAACELF